MHTVYFSLGTNLGDREHNLTSAIQEISQRIGSIVAQSDFIETKPWGFESKNLFLNAAIKVSTVLTPIKLLSVTQQIERDLGRTEKTRLGKGITTSYHDRIIDIDILLYYENGEKSINISTPTLTLPHPLMRDRDFVLIPLKQIL